MDSVPITETPIITIPITLFNTHILLTLNQRLNFDTIYVMLIHHNTAPIAMPPIPQRVTQMVCSGKTKPNLAKRPIYSKVMRMLLSVRKNAEKKSWV